MKFRVEMSVSLEYEVDPRTYGTKDVTKMAAIDEENFRNDPFVVFEIADGRDALVVKVTPVESTEHEETESERPDDNGRLPERGDPEPGADPSA